MNKQILQKLASQNLSQRQIASRLKVSQTTIKWWMCKFNIKTCFIGNKKIECICKFCGKILHNHQHKFCSLTCCSLYKKKEKYKQIEKDEQFKTFVPIKNYLIDKYGKKCFKCGWAEKNLFSGSIPIETNHVDGDRKNNKLSNIELLCPNCHSLTKTYRVLNRK